MKQYGKHSRLLLCTGEYDILFCLLSAGSLSVSALFVSIDENYHDIEMIVVILKYFYESG